MAAGTFTHRFDLPAATLKRIIDKTDFPISSEETRYYLCGIYLHTRQGKDGPMLCAVATDGHRLAKVEIRAPEGSDGMPAIIVPTKPVERLKAMAASHDGDITIEVADTKIRATAAATVMTSKLIDRTYPDYRRVIRRGNDKRLSVDLASLAATVDRVSTIANEKGSAVKLDIVDVTLTLKVNNADAGSAEQTVDVVWSGPDMQIGFNGSYLKDVLDVIASQQVAIALGDPGSPALVTNP